MARYRLRYFFDAGGGNCLWADNDAARDAFGYPVESQRLRLSQNTRTKMQYLMAWYDTSLDWDYPAGPSPWDATERTRFFAEARSLLELLREELGSDFDVIDESTLENQDP